MAPWLSVSFSSMAIRPAPVHVVSCRFMWFRRPLREPLQSFIDQSSGFGVVRPEGMVASAIEFGEICRKHDYHDFIFSGNLSLAMPGRDVWARKASVGRELNQPWKCGFMWESQHFQCLGLFWDGCWRMAGCLSRLTTS